MNRKMFLIVLLGGIMLALMAAQQSIQSARAQQPVCRDATGKIIPCDTEKKKKPTVTDVPTSTATPTKVPTSTPTLVPPGPYPYPGGGGPVVALPWWWFLLGLILIGLLAGLFIPPLFRPRPHPPGPGPDPALGQDAKKLFPK